VVVVARLFAVASTRVTAASLAMNVVIIRMTVRVRVVRVSTIVVGGTVLEWSGYHCGS